MARKILKSFELMNTRDKRIYTDQFAPSIKLNESVFIA